MTDSGPAGDPPGTDTASREAAAATLVLLVAPGTLVAAACVWLGHEPIVSVAETASVGASLAVFAGMSGIGALYVAGAWRVGGWIPRASAHQLAAPAWGLLALVSFTSARMEATDRFVAIREEVEPWLVARAVLAAPGSLAAATEVAGIAPPHDAPRDWSRVHVWRHRRLGRGVVVDTREGRPPLALATGRVPSARRAHRPDEIDWLAFVTEAHGTQGSGEKAFEVCTRYARLVDRDGNWLAVGVTSRRERRDRGSCHLGRPATTELVERVLAAVERP